jgi:hypothetical protein
MEGSVYGDRLLFVRGILAGVVLGLTMTPVIFQAGTGTSIGRRLALPIQIRWMDPAQRPVAARYV